MAPAYPMRSERNFSTYSCLLGKQFSRISNKSRKGKFSIKKQISCLLSFFPGESCELINFQFASFPFEVANKEHRWVKKRKKNHFSVLQELLNFAHLQFIRTLLSSLHQLRWEFIYDHACRSNFAAAFKRVGKAEWAEFSEKFNETLTRMEKHCE